VFEQVGAGLASQVIAHRLTLTAVLRMAAVMGRMDYGVEMCGP
jgi:hypothetical protein